MHMKRLEELSLSEIIPNRFQPRIHFDDTKIESLAKSIMTYGVLEPIIVRPLGDKYEIVAGERRFKASKMAGKSTIPAIIVDFNDKESIELALLENIQRQELTAIEEAIAYRRILDMGQITQEELAKKTGKSQPTIANKMRLLALDDETQEALIKHKISERHARSLLKLSGTPDELKMLKRIIEKRLTVRDTDQEIAKLLEEKTMNRKEEKGENKFMDIERIMKEAQDINAAEEPKNLNDFVTTPSPYETILENNNQAPMPQIDDIADIMGTNIKEDHNKFINIIPEPEKTEITEEQKPENKHSEITFDNVFNGIFDVPTSNYTQTEEPLLEATSTKTPILPVEEQKNMIDNVSLTDSEILASRNFELPNTDIDITPINKDVTPVISEVAQNIIPEAEMISNLNTSGFSPSITESMPTEDAPIIPNTSLVEENIVPEIEIPISTSVEIPNDSNVLDIPEFTSTIAESMPAEDASTIKISSPSYDSIESLDFPEDSSENNVVQVEQKIPVEKDFSKVLEVLNECSNKIKALGYEVNTNEINLENIYQMTILIKKL